jgi:hypothetical protein
MMLFRESINGPPMSEGARSTTSSRLSQGRGESNRNLPRSALYLAVQTLPDLSFLQLVTWC